MLRYVLTTITILSFIGTACAYSSPYFDPTYHIGALCTYCHQKYSYRQPYAENLTAPVKNSEVINMFPCDKDACHHSSPVRWGERGNRYSFHTAERICKNCHGINGEYSIHKIHRNDNTSVDCNICHKSPMGWPSSKVAIPAYENLYIADSALINTSIRVPQWSNDCGYCHKSVANAGRLHDVHESAIERACVECHGQIIESVPNPLKKAIIEGPSADGMVRVKPSLMEEFSTLFERISLRFLSFYNFMRE